MVVITWVELGAILEGEFLQLSIFYFHIHFI
jgi:hypothetical protein